MKKILLPLMFFAITFTLQGQQDQTINGTTFKTNGNVGIGTASPNIWFNSHVVELNHNRPVFSLKSNDVLGTLVFTNIGVDATNHLGEFHINHEFLNLNPGSSRIRFGAYPAGDILTLQADGDVGIGTIDPQTKLHVEGNVNGWLQQIKGTVTQKGEFLGIKFHTGYPGEYNKWAGITAVGESIHSNDTGLGFFAGQTEHMRLSSYGSLGIGTTSTGAHKLAVEGSIGAREVKVSAGPGWPDYVFDSDYQLRSLDEVEQHIAEKGYLPEIPSEAEVTENGIYLGEMNAKLLQKIEELTLYMIDMNKQVKAQSAEIGNLKSENIVLKNEISSLKTK